MLKAFTIQKTNEADITKFHENRALQGLTPAGYFSQLLNQTQNKVNPINTDSLNEKIKQLENSLENLENLNTRFRKKNAELMDEIHILKQSKIEFPEFIASPSIDLANKVKRAAIYEIKNGKLSKTNFLQDFTNNALNYFIKNEYNHILK
jgi:hypothetical protein